MKHSHGAPSGKHINGTNTQSKAGPHNGLKTPAVSKVQKDPNKAPAFPGLTRPGRRK